VDPDQAAIADVVQTFFAAFTSSPGSAERLDALRRILLPQAVIVRTCGEEPVVYDVEAFIAPRQQWLSDGTLVDFAEGELSGRTEIYGDIAAHFCAYAKTGTRDGGSVAGRGMKSMQLVRTPGGWRISAVAWDDERPGLPPPRSMRR